jgi:hypothetical protein
MPKHPVEDAIARMSPRDQRMADQLYELGFTDEDLYAALPTPNADKLLEGGMCRSKSGAPVACRRLQPSPATMR